VRPDRKPKRGIMSRLAVGELRAQKK